MDSSRPQPDDLLETSMASGGTQRTFPSFFDDLDFSNDDGTQRNDSSEHRMDDTPSLSSYHAHDEGFNWQLGEQALTAYYTGHVTNVN